VKDIHRPYTGGEVLEPYQSFLLEQVSTKDGKTVYEFTTLAVDDSREVPGIFVCVEHYDVTNIVVRGSVRTHIIIDALEHIAQNEEARRELLASREHNFTLPPKPAV
jgi:hypothetical protein